MKKHCTNCKSLKPLAGFSKDKNRKDGYNPWCKICLFKARKAWRQKGAAKKFRGYCKTCQKPLIAEKKIKYCNNTCQAPDVQKMFAGKKKNYPIWNEGTKGICKPNDGSFKRGEHRSQSTEFKRGEYCGGKHHFWRGGITELRNHIRGCYEYRQWRSDVFTRDRFTCQLCGQVSGKLNADHIVPFTTILQKYEITTVDQAIDCAELWNINNGRTLCIECHRRTDNYGSKAKKLRGVMPNAL